MTLPDSLNPNNSGSASRPVNLNSTIRDEGSDYELKGGIYIASKLNGDTVKVNSSPDVVGDLTRILGVSLGAGAALAGAIIWNIRRQRRNDPLAAYIEDYAPADLAPILTSSLHSGREKAQDLRETVSDYVKDEIVPRALDYYQRAVEGLNNDVLPRVNDLKEQAGPQLTRAANRTQSAASELVDQVNSLLSDTVAPRVRDVAETIADTMTSEIIPQVRETAARTPERLNEVINTSKSRANDLWDKGVDRSNELFDASKSKVSDLRDTTNEKLTAAGEATKEAASNFSGTVFWLGVLGGLLVAIFAPEKEQREKLWRQAQELKTQVTELIEDFRGIEESGDANLYKNL